MNFDRGRLAISTPHKHASKEINCAKKHRIKSLIKSNRIVLECKSAVSRTIQLKYNVITELIKSVQQRKTLRNA